MISYDVYNVFYHVCNFKSITKAADYLHVSQPAVTRHIKNLETHLGITLFYRTRNGLTLTSDGEKLYEQVSKGINIFNEIEENFNNFKDSDIGHIKILAGAATTKLIVLPALIKFNETHPKVTFEINHYPVKEALVKLRNGEADLLILNSQDYDIQNDLVIKNFLVLHDIFVVNSNIKDRFPEKIYLKDFNNYPIITKKEDGSSRIFLSEELKRRYDITFNPRWQVSDYSLIEEYVKRNMGIGILSKELVKESIDSNIFEEIDTDVTIPPKHIGYAMRKSSVLSPILIKFLSVLREVGREINDE